MAEHYTFKKEFADIIVQICFHVLEVWVEKKTGLQFQTFDKSGMLHAGILALGGAFGHAHVHFGAQVRVWACTRAIGRRAHIWTLEFFPTNFLKYKYNCNFFLFRLKNSMRQ